jgi:hypothetical protein
MYISIIYGCSSSFARNQYFYDLCKKRENLSSEKTYFSIEFCLYTRHASNRFFMKRFCECVAREDVLVNFSFQCFKISNMRNMHFIIKEAYAPVYLPLI